jgi:hypothetical protein
MLFRPVNALSKVVNERFAHKPEFVIIGTGRCGTTFTASFLTESGLPFSHERYYTPDGPMLRNSMRSYKARGDASWLAVPYLPDDVVTVVHQVRNPLSVIKSFYNIGFFDPAHYDRHKRYVDFAQRHFAFSEEPLHSCVRWYLEWNRRCEEITPHRFQVERIGQAFNDIAGWFGHGLLSRDTTIPTDLNSRPRVVSNAPDDLRAQVQTFPEYAELCIMAERYGYDV